MQTSIINKESKIICLATNNDHKAEEFADLAGGVFKFITIKELMQETGKPISWDETGATFEENAKIKADVLAQYTDLPILADDSGLLVEVLNGEPGVYSSSYGGMEGNSLRNMNMLISKLKKLPQQQFLAKFVCCLWYREGDNTTKTFLGECRGEIILTPQGQQGFGYDPIFLVEGSTKTLAEMTLDEKNKISHRTQAFNQWLGWWKGRTS